MLDTKILGIELVFVFVFFLTLIGDCNIFVRRQT